MQNQQSLWHIFGNTYDLNQFMDSHPGGKEIIQITQGQLDITAMFESNHAFTDLDMLRNMLQKYQVGKSDYKIQNTFNKNEFYDVVRSRVREYFGNQKQLTQKIKINNFWIIKVILFFLLFLINFYFAFFKENLSNYQAILHSILAATFKMATAFCVFHDGSHFALFYGKQSYLNGIFAKIMASIMLWSQQMWLMHHTYRHHAYTGNSELDPDKINSQPFYRKTDKISNKKYYYIPKSIFNYTVNFINLIFPGYFFGQILSYWMIWNTRKFIWRMKLPTQIMKRMIWEDTILFFFVFIHLYKANLFVTISYMVTSNIIYALAIIPDHDTQQTQLNNDDNRKDWGEMQVRNSANFLNGKYFDIYNQFFGGINYQIEHHLFPTVCGVHLNKIQPIVKATCKEFNIPYVHHQSIFSAYQDFLVLAKEINNY